MSKLNVDTTVITKEGVLSEKEFPRELKRSVGRWMVVSIAADLLKAHRIGIRNLKEHLSRKFLSEILVITDRGTPVSVNLPYSDVLELVDILDELADLETTATVDEGRRAVKAGAKSVPVSNLFNRIRAKRK